MTNTEYVILLHMAYEQLLEQVGLSLDESKVYETLLKNGIMPAGCIPLKSGLKRGLVYKILTTLEKEGLIEKIDSPGKVALFAATHPGKLREKLLKKEEEIKAAEASLGGIMGSLVSDYNLFKGKPNVQFFEGLEGAKKLLDDNFTATETICCYMNDETLFKYTPDLDIEHQKKALKAGIKKKIIFLEKKGYTSPDAGHYPTWIESKIVQTDMEKPFQTLIQIYDGKISYLTILSEKEMIGVIIEDKYAYELHKFLFEYQWKTMPPSVGAKIQQTDSKKPETSQIPPTGPEKPSQKLE